MSIKITYFVHGTTTDNEKKLSTGWNSGELSPVGKERSRKLGELVADKKFDLVFCSDLKRAVDSAHLAFGNKYQIVEDKRLRECNYGEFNSSSEEQVNYQKHIEQPFPQGESLQDVEKRIKDFLIFLERNYQNKSVAIMAHKAPQLALDVLTKGKTWSEAIAEDWRKSKAWQAGWEYSF